MTKARDLADYTGLQADLAGLQTNITAGDTAARAGRKNLIINGGFDVWQRGTSFTADNIYTTDRWKSADGSGGSPARTASQQVFALGQTDVPDAHYYFRHDQTSGTSNGNSSFATKIEDVTRTAGKTLTLSFYAKANASMTIGPRFIQGFGSGGSPSSSVEITETTVTIGTSWTKHTLTVTMPSISGKTIGSDGVHTSSTILNIDFNPTGTFTFEIAQVQLELGSVATDFEHRSYGEELALCQRYFYQHIKGSSIIGLAALYTATLALGYVNFPVTMRAAPTGFAASGSNYYVCYAGGVGPNFNGIGQFSEATTTSIRLVITLNTNGTAGFCGSLQTGHANADISFSAEL